MWKDWWIYFIAPPLGMLAAAETYVKLAGAHNVICAKLYHGTATEACIFKCGYQRANAKPEQSHEVPPVKAKERFFRCKRGSLRNIGHIFSIAVWRDVNDAKTEFLY
jgi:hypothetical protein